MEKVPLLRTWMRRLHCLFIDRENVKEALKTILAGIDNVKTVSYTHLDVYKRQHTRHNCRHYLLFYL